jgi:hypothetical protein
MSILRRLPLTVQCSAPYSRLNLLQGETKAMDTTDRLAEFLLAQPFLDLGKLFEPEPVLKEALAHLAEFVPHSGGSTGSAGWRSLAIKSIGGNSTRTEAAHRYRDNNAQQTAFTPLWSRCPATKAVLTSSAKVNAARRIRFMMVEPSGYIAPHKDSDDFLSVTVNYVVNVPDGSRFWVDINADGTHGPMTSESPLIPGHIILINVACCHALRNSSDAPRIHIIVEGGLSMNLEELLYRQMEAANMRDIRKRAVQRIALL